MCIKLKKQISYQIERYPTSCKECPAYYERPYFCHNERKWEGHCKLHYFSTRYNMTDYNRNQLYDGCRIKKDPRVTLIPEEAAKPCGYCHADSNGQHDMFTYEHSTRPQRSAAISFYGGELTVDINHPEEPITHRLSCKINYCPFCGRSYTEEDDNE